jgi:hypothetical protein
MTTPGVRTSRSLLKEQILISPWPDPTIDALGYDMRDRDTAPGDAPYVETFWLPVVGPTTLLLLRRATVTSTPDGPVRSPPNCSPRASASDRASAGHPNSRTPSTERSGTALPNSASKAMSSACAPTRRRCPSDSSSDYPRRSRRCIITCVSPRLDKT